MDNVKTNIHSNLAVQEQIMLTDTYVHKTH